MLWRGANGGARRGHSLQSCEKSLERGKVKVGEEPTAGAELMLLDTTEDAGTWRARKSASGLVGSSVGGWRQRWRRGKKNKEDQKEVLEEKKGQGGREEKRRRRGLDQGR